MLIWTNNLNCTECGATDRTDDSAVMREFVDAHADSKCLDGAD